MKLIKLMGEYHAWPTWYGSGPEVGDFNPSELPISKELVEDLNKWADKYTATLNHDYPPYSGFSTEQDLQQFINEGEQLQKRLETELGNEYKVEYNSELYGIRSES